jgi:hypothetical protein
MKKALLVCVALAAALCAAGCLREPEVWTDTPAGKTLVIYWGKNRYTKHAAYHIAGYAGAALFDIAGKKPFPNHLDFDNFFIGVPLTDGAIPDSVAAFLSGVDFVDGYAALFLTSQTDGKTRGGSFAPLLTGARLLGEREFPGVSRLSARALGELAGSWADSMLSEFAARRTAGLRAEYVMKAFAHAYPERITEIAFHDGDWALRMDDVWYYYSGGRIIPETERENAARWTPQQIYRYSPELPNEPAEAGPLGARLVKSRRFQFSSSRGGQGALNSSAKRYPFLEKLLNTQDRDEAFKQQQNITFLGYRLTAHRAVAGPLAQVEKQVLAEANTNEVVSAWLKSVYSVICWNWRNIAGTERLSYHSYGIAVDLQMLPRPGMETYWQWTAAKGIDWRSVPREQRLEPPSAVIRIFEENGFLWGGKWPWYDTMHFEFRPEILLLSF